MISRKTVALGAVALTIVGTTAFVSTSAFAQSTDGQTTMIQKLAQKLGVPEDKVKVAFDELHSERHTEMKKNMETRLSELVSQGKLTEAQKQAILAKMEELKTEHQNLKTEMQNMTPEQRMQRMEQERTELENWAKSQGIDPSLLPMMKFKMHRGMGEGQGDKFIWRMGPTASPTTQ